MTVGGRDARTTSLAALAANVGVLFQDPETQLVMLETNDEIAFGLENLAVARDEMRMRVAEARSATGLGPATPRRIDQLSGGTKQRVALAALLAMRPRGVVLDEPTANLDPAGAREVLAAYAALCRDRERSLLLVEHRLDLVTALVDRVAVMGEEGAIVLDGDPERVFMRDRDRLAALGVWRPELAELAHALGTSALPRDAAAAAAIIRERWPVAVGPPARDVTGGPALIASGLAYRYPGTARNAVEAVSLALRASEITALVGANGAGKSTLGLLLAGALRPSTGTAAFADHPVADAAAAGRIAYVFQYPERGFLTATVRDELAYSARARGEAPAREVDDLLERFGLARLAEANPHTLSHGEKRRLSVASALVTRPDALVLDEPTFGQDARHTQELIAILHEEERAGRAVVIITHDLSLVADHAARVVALSSGRVAFDGTPRDLFERPDVLSACGLALPPIAEAFAIARERRPELPSIVGLAEARAALATVATT